MPRQFVAIGEFRDGWWSVRVEQLDGVVAHATKRRDAEISIRDAIALALNANPSSFEVRTIFADPEQSLYA